MKCYGNPVYQGFAIDVITITNNNDALRPKKKPKCTCWSIENCRCNPPCEAYDIIICWCCERHKHLLRQPKNKEDIGRIIMVPTTDPDCYVSCDPRSMLPLVPEECAFDTV